MNGKQLGFVHPLRVLARQCSNQKSIQLKQQSGNSDSRQNNLVEEQYLLSVKQDSVKTKQIVKLSKKKQPSNVLSYQNPNYRTKMCPDGMECRRRLTCTFAHNQYQLRKPFKNRKEPCVRYQKGLCHLGPACPDYHGNVDLKKANYKYKEKPCKEFLETGSCKKGELCIFIHQQPNQTDKKQIEQQRQKIFLQENVSFSNNSKQLFEGEQIQNKPVSFQLKNQKNQFNPFKQKDRHQKQKQQKRVHEQIQTLKQKGEQEAVDEGFNIAFNF